MTDSVNFNPITGNPFSALEIEHLDLDKDGVVSSSELEKGMSWLSGTDTDSDVSIENGNQLYSRAKSLGVNESAKTVDEFKSFMATIMDEFVEQFFTANASTYTQDELAVFQKLISTKSNEFIAQYLTDNPNGPWDMKVASAEFSKFIENAIAENKALKNNNDSVIAGYQDNLETNYLSLLDLAMAANENKNISQAEFNQMKTKAVQYLMGVLLTEDSDKSFLESLDPKYQSNAYYKKALQAINQIKNSTDPAQVKELLNEAMTNLTRFVESKGAQGFTEAVIDFKDSQTEENVRSILNEYVDKYKESVITSDMPAETVAYLEKFLSNTVDKFVAKLAEQGDADTYTVDTLQAQFASYLESQMAELVQIQTRAVESVTEITKSFDNLVSISDNANLNGNISADEKAQIIDAAVELLYSQLIMDITDLTFLESLNPNYKSSADFKEIMSMANTLKTSVDPDEIKDLTDKIKTALKEYLNKFEGDKLVTAVNSIKPVEATDKTKDKAIFDSTISADYAAGATRTTSRGKQNEERLDEIQEMAKQDMLAVAEQLKAQLKAQLGDAYVEADVEKYIQDAMNDTIAMFTQGITRRDCDGNYSTDANNYAFEFLDRSGTSKGRYTYNVKALIDTFVQFFNQASAQKAIRKLDPSVGTYDRENVIADSLGDDYWRNKSEKEYGHKSDENTYAKIIAEATEDLKLVGESLKRSLMAEGTGLSESEINEIVDACIADTITDMKNAFQYCQPGGTTTGGGIASYVAGAGGLTGMALGGTATLATAGTAIGAAVSGTSTAAIAALTTENIAFLTTFAGAEVATSAGVVTGSAYATTTAVASAVPVVGWCVAGALVALGALSSFTNLFGATYGKHNSDAGFYFERKSHSKSGNWGYDTQTLVNLFFNKVDAKIAEAKNKKVNESNGLENL